MNGLCLVAAASVLLQFSGTSSRRSIAMVALDEPKTPFSPVKRTSPKKAAKSVKTPVGQEMPTKTPTPETREMSMQGSSGTGSFKEQNQGYGEGEGKTWC